MAAEAPPAKRARKRKRKEGDFIFEIANRYFTEKDFFMSENKAISQVFDKIHGHRKLFT